MTAHFHAENNSSNLNPGVFITNNSHGNANDWINGSYGYLVKTLYFIVSVTGITGNLLVIIAFYQVKQLRNLTNRFIVSLAITDLIACLMMALLKQLPGYRLPSGVFGEIVCRIVTSEFLLWVTCGTSVWHLTATSLERYYGIVHPLSYHNIFNKKTVRGIICLIWIVAILLNVYFVFIFHVSSDGTCVVRWPGQKAQIVTGIAVILLTEVVPVSIMLLTYTKIILSLRSDERHLTNTGQGENSKAMLKLKARRNVIKMLCMIVITFLVCFTPNQVIFFMYNLGYEIDFNATYYQISVFLVFANSCINPIIYALKNNSFRRGLRLLFCGTRNQVDPEIAVVFTPASMRTY
ncbi:somatostatin receptor type 2-like [Glandiceps talaboti]